MTFTIATFYHFVSLPDCAALQPLWKAKMLEYRVTGTILVTPEGINSTIAGSADGVANMLNFLKQDTRLTNLVHKESYADKNPFPRTKVKLKKETIPLGVQVDPSKPGTYISPQEWNTLIRRPDVTLVDTRNSYEVKIGQFAGAQDPCTQTFKQLPAWCRQNLPEDKNAPIAMYCTGGIRCEKSTSYLKQQGYNNVYHLQGGILKYLEEIPQEQSLWQGACYVFDDRVAVRHDLSPATEYQVCKSCNKPVTAADFKRHASAADCSALC